MADRALSKGTSFYPWSPCEYLFCASLPTSLAKSRLSERAQVPGPLYTTWLSWKPGAWGRRGLRALLPRARADTQGRAVTGIGAPSSNCWELGMLPECRQPRANASNTTPHPPPPPAESPLVIPGRPGGFQTCSSFHVRHEHIPERVKARPGQGCHTYGGWTGENRIRGMANTPSWWKALGGQKLGMGRGTLSSLSPTFLGT